MQLKAESPQNIDNLHYLPSFANYLLTHRLRDFVVRQLQISRQIDVPLLRAFSNYTDEEIIQLSLATSGELLTYLSENNAQRYIDISVKRWLANELPNIDKYDVKAEDITLITYVRKTAFMHFITEYSKDAQQMLHLINDIDLYLLESETASTNTYINLLKDRIEEHASQINLINDQLQHREQQLLEAQEIAEMGSFEWDLIEKNSQVTDQLMKILELNELTNFNEFLSKVHPDDQDKVRAAIKDALHNTGVYECQYRYRGKNKEKILLSRGIVTYKNDVPLKMNGTVMDITERYHITDALQRSEERYRQAEAFTHIGHYEWDINSNELVWSDELYRIHGLDPQIQNITYEKVGQFIHPDDLMLVNDATNKAIHELESFDYHYRIIVPNENEKILHARGELMLDKAGKPVKIIGTVQDVTEKQTFIRKLRKSEDLYKQAEQLANMGNYIWDVEKNTIEWTDQLYIMYGLQPQSETITLERFLSFVHPDDKKEVEEGLKNFFNQNSTDYTFRIITANNVVKTIRSIAEVQLDANGKPVRVIGTEQDVTEREKLIEKLQHSEILYKQAQAISHIGNWIYYIDSQTFEWSEEMYRIYEIAADQTLNLEDFISKLHPDDRVEVMKQIDKCIQNKTFYDKHHRIALPDGRIKTIHRRGEIIVDSTGKPVKMIGTSQDVTERERFEQELKENQIFIKKIADATPSIIASYNVNTGKYVFVNEGVRKLLNYDPEEILSKGVEFFADVIHPDDVDSLISKNNKALHDANADPKSDSIVEFTYRMKHKDGHYKWFHTYGTIFDRNESGKVEHVLNISLDVTSQVEANKKIEEQEHFIEHIADASPTILYLFDVQSESFIYINKEVYYILGYTPEELINAKNGLNYLLYHTEDCGSLPERKGSNKKFSNAESMMQYECKMKAKDGDWKWMLIREIPFKTDEDGTISQILGAALDISLRKEMEKSLLQNSYQLEQSNANLEEFAYIASHDLKEPLRKISTFGDRLYHTQVNNLSDDGKLYLSKIIDASQRMQTMISDLLSISLIASDTSFQSFSLQDILEDSLQALEHKIEQKNATIRSDSLPDARIVPSQFRQLFQNLISNSLKFAQDNEPPLIEIKHNYISSADVENSHLSDVQRYHQLQFIDNGIGFENEYAGKIFAIFQRLHGRTEYEGTGIGLAICKKIIEHHGGSITASGEPGKGAVFTIILPEK